MVGVYAVAIFPFWLHEMGYLRDFPVWGSGTASSDQMATLLASGDILLLQDKVV
jgi:hypothetical protein